MLKRIVRYTLTLIVLISTIVSLNLSLSLDADAQDFRVDNSQTSSLSDLLHTPSREEFDKAAREVRLALDHLNHVMASEPIGMVYREQMQLDLLEVVLAKTPIDADSILKAERRLLHYYPGKFAEPVRSLKSQLIRFSNLARFGAEPMDRIRESLARIESTAKHRPRNWSIEDDDRLREDFALVARCVPQDDRLTRLRNQLSLPNCLVWVDRSYALKYSAFSHSAPVDFTTCQSEARIRGVGKLCGQLNMNLLLSELEVPLQACLQGGGTIEASADRKRIHIRAQLRPSLQMTELAHIQPARVSFDTPQINFHIPASVEDVSIDGVIGKSHLIKNLASRVVSELLAKNEPTMAEKAKSEIRSKVEEKTAEVAFKINQILKSGVWDRIEAMDFAPKVQLQSRTDGLNSRIDYARRDQLGALTDPPKLEPASGWHLDRIVSVHESTINNLSDLLLGTHLDELTWRSLIEGQFGLTSLQWKNLAAGRAPAAIVLDSAQQLHISFKDRALHVRIPIEAVELDGRRIETDRSSVELRYELDLSSSPHRLVRTFMEIQPKTNTQEDQLCKQVIDLLFPESFQPETKFAKLTTTNGNSTRFDFEARDGWLIVGFASSNSASGVE